MSGLNGTRRGYFLGIAIGLNALNLLPNCALTQIKPDGTLPNNTTVSREAQTFNINGGTQAGRNLFHSFQEFSVPNGFTASINNAADIRNIFGRVTGGSVSNIDGLIKASGTANLFLMNPNGIVFGKNARLDIGGSFVASTANRLKFADGFEFSATNSQSTPLLTISAPIGLQFGNNPGDILNQSQIGLQVQPGKTLALVGGNVSFDGGIVNAPSGRVELGGVSQPGTLGLNVDGDMMSLIFPDGVNRASVSLKNAAAVDVSGDGSGSIAINARNLDILGQSNLKANVFQFNTPIPRVGDITLNATEAIKIGQSSKVESAVWSKNATSHRSDNATLHGSDINITTGSLSVIDGSQLNLSTEGILNAGNVNIKASNISFDGKDSNDAHSGIVNIVQKSNGDGDGNTNILIPKSTGNGGNISINTETLSIINGASVNAINNGKGATGVVTIDASDRISLDGSGSGVYNLVNLDSIGNSGGIGIKTGTLSITNDAQLNTSNSGMGNAGSVTIEALDRVSLNGSKILIGVNNRAGKGGNITVTSGDISLADGSIINLSTNGQGDAGSALFDTGTFSLTNGSKVNINTNGRGSTGSLTINASDRILLDGSESGVYNLVKKDVIGDSGDIRVNQDGIGNSASIRIKTGRLLINNQAQLNTSTDGKGNAGDVMIEARDRVSLNRGNIYTTVNNRAIGKGGNVTITSGDISLANGSYIILTTKGQGNAGNAVFKARSLSLTGGSILTTSSTSKSNAGEIHIDATESVSLSGNHPDYRNSTEIASDTLDTATGLTGNIKITTNAFRVSDGAIINASNISNTPNETGGSITIKSKTFEATSGGQLLTNTSGSTNAGKITVNATDRVTVSGSDPTVSERRRIYKASSERGSLANAGEASGFFAQSFLSSGSAGDIEVNAPQIRLDNSGKFSAESDFGNGGNITLNGRDLLQLRSGSLISTIAGKAKQDGNGGNITINTPNGFIVAVPNENNYITANAFKGAGGKVEITATGIYGLKVLNRQDLVKIFGSDLAKLDFQQLPSSITAVSQTNTNLNGQVNINTPGIDPSRGSFTLPAQIVDASQRLVASCSANGTTGNSFINTGRGGLPPSPNEPLSPDVLWSDTRLLAVQQQETSMPKPKFTEIVPATGWVFNGKGEVELISSALGSTLPTSCLKR